jgi:hypothetical protein
MVHIVLKEFPLVYALDHSGNGGETDVSPDCGRFYVPFVRPQMRISEGVNG